MPTNYIVRLHSENGSEVRPVRVQATSPREAVHKATGRTLTELAEEDQHKALAVVTREEKEDEDVPRYFG